MKNLRVAITIVIALLYWGTAAGQSAEIDKSAQAEIEKLSFIVGEWEGEGWMLDRDGTKHTFTQTENVQFKLDNTALLIEGVGRSGGEIIHNALAIVRSNQQERGYTFNSYLSNGLGGEFKGEIIDDKFYWYPNENMRYIIELNEERQWFETGEIKREGTWVQFFEMTLDKV